ncbi:ATP-binding protein [Paracoccus beibuensis]|uniref:ATP-binding protein n=1 Tax=Paracoccus beibuensis TaxID=547602 RepID=UPI0022405042|nr:ATP-binding protein [Paracoccus beibuensis]
MGQSDGLRRRGQPEAAAAIDAIAGTIHDRVDREPGRARIGGRGPADAHQVAQGLVPVLSRTPRGDHIAIRNDLPERVMLPIDAADLADPLGSLMENALRHAGHPVRISHDDHGGQRRIQVEDDGRGVSDADLNRIVTRGLSLDEGSTGLGLALARDIAAAAAAGAHLHVTSLSPGFRASLVFDDIVF